MNIPVALLTIAIAVVAGVSASAQSQELVDLLKKRMIEIYGDAAPTSVTFVTLPPGSLGGFGRGGLGIPTRGGAQSVDPEQHKAGDSATGVVLEERGNELYLDANPCNGRVATFVKPFLKKESGKVTCNGKVHVTQRVVQE